MKSEPKQIKLIDIQGNEFIVPHSAIKYMSWTETNSFNGSRCSKHYNTFKFEIRFDKNITYSDVPISSISNLAKILITYPDLVELSLTRKNGAIEHYKFPWKDTTMKTNAFQKTSINVRGNLSIKISTYSK